MNAPALTTPALTITPIPTGWAVVLTNGHQIARFSGPASKWRAQRYLATCAKEARRDGQ